VSPVAPGTPAVVIPPIVQELAKTVEIRNVQIMKIRAEGLPHAPGDVIASLTYELGGDARKGEDALRAIHCFFGVRVMGKTAESGGRDVADIGLVVGLAYEVTSPELFARLTDGDIRAFAAVNGIRHAWPYVRELCQNLSMRMGVTPMLLPVLAPSVVLGDLSRSPDFKWKDDPPTPRPPDSPG
jgi:hypothetical protein